MPARCRATDPRCMGTAVVTAGEALSADPYGGTTGARAPTRSAKPSTRSGRPCPVPRLVPRWSTRSTASTSSAPVPETGFHMDEVGHPQDDRLATRGRATSPSRISTWRRVPLTNSTISPPTGSSLMEATGTRRCVSRQGPRAAVAFAPPAWRRVEAPAQLPAMAPERHRVFEADPGRM